MQYEQDARIALMQFFDSNKRGWATIVLAWTVASLSLGTIHQTLLQGYPWIFVILICCFATQILYGILRFLWYGQKLTYIESEPAKLGKGTYINRLDNAVEGRVVEHKILKKIPYGRFLYWLHGIGPWFIFSFVVTGFLLVLTCRLMGGETLLIMIGLVVLIVGIIILRVGYREDCGKNPPTFFKFDFDFRQASPQN